MALEPIFANIPSELCEHPQWVLWRHSWRPELGKYAKVPYQCNGSPASSTDPLTWQSFGAAESAFENAIETSRAYSGIGFVFSDNDPYVGIDVDKCRDPASGKLSDIAVDVCATLNGAYAEVSPSATGLHFIVRGRLRFKGKKDDTIGLEMYRSGRYFCVTGHAIGGVE